MRGNKEQEYPGGGRLFSVEEDRFYYLALSFKEEDDVLFGLLYFFRDTEELNQKKKETALKLFHLKKEYSWEEIDRRYKSGDFINSLPFSYRKGLSSFRFDRGILELPSFMSYQREDVLERYPFLPGI